VEQQLQQIKDIVRLVDIGVLEEDYYNEWASPSFSIPNKNGRNTIRVVTDFRKLNLLIKHKSHPFPIPKIGDMIYSVEGFTFASVSHFNMENYPIKLDADAQKLCKIVFPWGKYNTNTYPWVSRLPQMFFKISCLSLSKIWNTLRSILMIC
jgi:hypothetical protein